MTSSGASSNVGHTTRPPSRRFASSDLRLAMSTIGDDAARRTVESEVVIALQKAYDRGRSEGYRSAKADATRAVTALAWDHKDAPSDG